MQMKQEEEQDAARESLGRFVMARESFLAVMNMRVMVHLGICVGDEIILPDKADDVLTIVAIRDGRYILKVRYGAIDTIDPDNDMNVPSVPEREYWISGIALRRMLEGGRCLHIKVLERPPERETSLLGLCLQATSRTDMDDALMSQVPSELHDEIRARAKHLSPIPIDVRIKRWAAPSASRGESDPSGLPDKSTDRRRSALSILPASVSYVRIWRACTESLLPSRPKAPHGTETRLDLQPTLGPAGFMAAYVAACRRGAARYELELERVWRVQPASRPADALPALPFYGAAAGAPRDVVTGQPVLRDLDFKISIRPPPPPAEAAPMCYVWGVWLTPGSLVRGPNGRWCSAGELARPVARRVGDFVNLGAG